MLPNRPSSSESNPSGFAAKGCGTLFFGIFTIAGLLFFGALGIGIWRTIQPYFWKATPCTIAESHRTSDNLEATTNSDDPVVIRYRYEVDGKAHESDKLEMGMKESLNTKRIEQLLFKYPANAKSVCYVNPQDPGEAVLHRGPLWPAAFILLPLVFIGVGVGGIVGMWRGGPKRVEFGRKGNSQAMGTLAKLLFFGLFALIGGILTYVIGVRSVQKYFSAKDWPATPCEIVSSSVGHHRGSEGGTTYSVDITYRYQVQGRDFQSDTYSLMAGSSSGRSSKERVVAQYPAGSNAVCYVNPEDPTDALLSRELSPWLLIGLVPGLFLLVGVVGLGSTARSALRGVLNRSAGPILPGVATAVANAPVVPPSVGPVALNPGYSPLAKLGGAVFIALFWNGIVSVFAWFVISSFINGKPEWILTIFITPFVLIGLLLIGLVGSAFLNLFNPRVRLTVSSQTIPIGGKLDANWSFNGSSSRIKRFKLTLEGREETTRGHGKNRRTNREVFVSLPLVDTIDPQQIAQGRASVEIPVEHKHTEDDGDRKVVWTLKAAGEIPRYPDFEEEYELTVLAREVH